MAIRSRVIYFVFFSLSLLLIGASSSIAQGWTHDPYEVDTVVTAVGTRAYSAGSTYGSVEALFPSGTDTYSEVNVKFRVQWGKGGPPVSATVAYLGLSLTGSAGSGSEAWAGVEAGSAAGSVTKNTVSDGNPFSLSNVSCGADSIFMSTYLAKVYGYGKVSKGTGSSGDGAAQVQANIS
jgi:hypothetical protein